MVRGLELVKERSIRPGMTQTALHAAMLGALRIRRDAVLKGFDYDASRKHCRAWLIQKGFLHEEKG